MYRFGLRSEENLTGVDPGLIRVTRRALSYNIIDISVISGVRTDEEQAKLYAQGRTAPGQIVTWTLDSNHLRQKDGRGHAVDLAPYINGRIYWDGVDDFNTIATLMFRAAMEEGVQIEWGGHWKKKDRPHYQLKET